jgi:hypothetical protein
MTQKISARVETLGGPDRETFLEAYDACYLNGGTSWGSDACHAERFKFLVAKAAWLSAAEMLLGQHDFWRVGHDGEGSDPSLFKAQVGVEREGECWHTFATAIAVDPALSLCAAALKARGL